MVYETNSGTLFEFTTLVLALFLVGIQVNLAAGACSERDYVCKFQQLCGREFTESNEYMIGGTNVQEDFHFPSFVHIVELAKDGNLTDKCSGAIVSDYHVLVSAHCAYEISEIVLEPWKLLVFAGTKLNLNIHKPVAGLGLSVKRICYHPEWRPSYEGDRHHNYDVAILLLKERLEFGSRIQPACWPYSLTSSKLQNGSKCYLVGDDTSARTNQAAKNSSRVQMLYAKEINCSKTEMNRLKGVRCFQPSGLEAACDSDLGGTILCLDRRSKIWTAIGPMIARPKSGKCEPRQPFAVASTDPSVVELMNSPCRPTIR